MELDKKYDPRKVEETWYGFWEKNNLFSSSVDPQKNPYTIVIPPPNVTGVLHMGHMLNNTIQDILIRRARMQGKNALWVPGTDHASIATEARVVAKLNEEGISKSDLEKTVGKPVETVPQIFIDQEHIGGCTEFESYAKENLGLFN